MPSERRSVAILRSAGLRNIKHFGMVLTSRAALFSAILYASVVDPGAGFEDNVTMRCIMNAGIWRGRRMFPRPPLPQPHAPSIQPYHTVAMQVWGFLMAAFACDVCGRPYTLEHKHGRYLWVGSRTLHLCVCWDRERGLAEENHLAYGVSQSHFPLFIDFVVMWLAEYSRGTVFGEMEQLGVGAARGRPAGSISYSPKFGASKKPNDRYGRRRSPSPWQCAPDAYRVARTRAATNGACLP